MSRRLVLLAALLAVLGCRDADPVPQEPPDAGEAPAGADAGTDGGADAGGTTDAGAPPDAGAGDAGFLRGEEKEPNNGSHPTDFNEILMP
ncbi:MAG: hypothetical protein ACK4N5_26910, partial [Myxococcales bacterium]